ncbi:MAG: Rpn family recombination-promoting nuclease/putative transposase [Gammaproteobacteria bacterium]
MTKSNLVNPHDGYFKQRLSNTAVAQDFMKHYLPEKILKQIDLATLRKAPTSFVGKIFNTSESDILYQINYLNNNAHLYVLVEHQSSVDAKIPLRLWRYMVSIWHEYLKQHPAEKYLPLIYPLVFYNGRQSYSHSLNFYNLFGDYQHTAQQILHNTFQLIELNNIRDDYIRNQPWAGVMQFVMKYIWENDIITSLMEIRAELAQLIAQDAKDYLDDTFTYIVVTKNIRDVQAFKKIFIKYIIGDTKMDSVFYEWFGRPAEEEGMAKGMAKGMEEGMQKGMQKGMQEGLAQGRQEGEKKVQKIRIEIAKRLLQKMESREVVQEVTGLSSTEIEQLYEELFTTSACNQLKEN